MQILTVLLFRALPFALYASCARRIPLLGRLGVVAAVMLLVWLLQRLGMNGFATAIRGAIGIAYLAVVATVFYAVSPYVARARLVGAPLFLAGCVLYVVVPGVLTGGTLAIELVTVGWERIYAAYSYCVETAKSKTRSTFADALFFLVVHPVLVYPERGQLVAPALVTAPALGRCALGLSALGARQLCLTWMIGLAQPPAAQWDPHRIGLFLAFASSLYFAHSGLASIQISFMQMLGWRVPERYRYPFLATNPEDFWQRWNIYLSSWARRYMFFPIAARLGRIDRRLRSVSKPIAALSAFLVIGAMHDFAMVVGRGNTAGWSASFEYGLLFAVMGLELVVWAAVRTLLQRVGPLARVRASAPRVLAVLSWALFMSLQHLNCRIALAPVTGSAFAESVQTAAPPGPD